MRRSSKSLIASAAALALLAGGLAVAGHASPLSWENLSSGIVVDFLVTSVLAALALLSPLYFGMFDNAFFVISAFNQAAFPVTLAGFSLFGYRPWGKSESL